MTLQRQHLAATLALLVRNLAYRDVLDGPLMDLGAQHVSFGARPEHYPVVRASLLGSLADALGPDWTAELAADWALLLDHAVAVMLEGHAAYVVKAVGQAARNPADSRT